MKWLMLLLCANVALASEVKTTLVVQSNAVSTMYGDSIARLYPNPRLIKLRDFYADVHDNRDDVFRIITDKAASYNNLVIIGYVGSFKHPNVTVLPLFANIAPYSEDITLIIRAFAPKAEVHTVCNYICPNVGVVHRVRTTQELRTLLLSLKNENNIVIGNSISQLFDTDRQRAIYGSDVANLFLVNSRHLEVSFLGHDPILAITLTVEPEDVIRSNGKLSVTVNLNRVLQLNKMRTVTDAASSGLYIRAR